MKISAYENGVTHGRRKVVPANREEKKVGLFRQVSEDERETAMLSKLETWQKIAADIVVVAPEKVSFEVRPQSDGISLKIKFSDDFLRLKMRPTLSIRYRGRKLAVLNVVGRERERPHSGLDEKNDSPPAPGRRW